MDIRHIDSVVRAFFQDLELHTKFYCATCEDNPHFDSALEAIQQSVR